MRDTTSYLPGGRGIPYVGPLRIIVMLRDEPFQDFPAQAVRFEADRLGTGLEVHQLELVSRGTPARLLLLGNGQRGLEGRPSGRSSAVSRGIGGVARPRSIGILRVRRWCCAGWRRRWGGRKQWMRSQGLSSKRGRWRRRPLYEKTLTAAYGPSGKEIITSVGHRQLWRDAVWKRWHEPPCVSSLGFMLIIITTNIVRLEINQTFTSLSHIMFFQSTDIYI